MLTEILVVEDNRSVRSALRRALESQGYRVSEAAGRAELLERLDKEPSIALITLDLMLGNEDGLELAREVRAKRNVPIVMITARTEPMDRVVGLEHGADDYIVKPFHFREVLLRVRSVLRRYALEQSATEGAPEAETGEERYACELGTIDLKCRVVIGPNGCPLALTDAEFDILKVFLRNPRRVLSRDDLTMLLKGQEWSPLDRTLDGHIARLRKKIEPDIETPRLIKTVWRVGYVFTGDVQRV